MSIEKFTKNKKVLTFINRAKKLKEEGKKFSDIIDTNNNQYVDLVQQGGGLLGIALVGYTYILESAGIRFLSLAGTSAGAINTLLMAGAGEVDETKSEKIIDILNKKDLFEVVDGHSSIKKIINRLIKKRPFILLLVLNLRRIYKTLKNKLGLNPGNNFEEWITNELKKSGIHTLKDLMELRKKLPVLSHRDNTSANDLEAKLAIITSEISTHSKIEFPEMAELYWKNTNDLPPAKMARASMSIPYFFEPYSVSNIPNTGKLKDLKWIQHASYYGPVPPNVKFVDGGMISNFPIDVFHRKDKGTPRMPTFGVMLSAHRSSFSKTNSFLSMTGAMVSTMRQVHDYDFILQNPDYKKLICKIDADEKFQWLDFDMNDDEKISLFNLGAEKAIQFLESFNWEEYKDLRR